MRSPEIKPAGFWLRYAAWSLDALFLLPLLLLLGKPLLLDAIAQAGTAMQGLGTAMAHLLDGATQDSSPLAMSLSLMTDPRTHAAVDSLSSALTRLLLLPPALYAALACLWSLGFECSAWQATPGKRAFGLVVTDADGARLGVAQALLRFVAAGLSWITLNLGHALVLFAPHLALHDRLSRTRVLAEPEGLLRPWQRSWLVLQFLASLVCVAWLFVALRDWMQAFMTQALSGI